MQEDIKADIITKIKKYLELNDQTYGKDNKIINVCELFDYLMTIPNFLCTQPKFRYTVINKINEFRNDEEAFNNNSFKFKLHQLENYIDNLKNKDNYISYIDDPNRIKIII